MYFGTPVVLISTRNPDGTANLAPMSSAWWLNDHCVLGPGDSARTAANLHREQECVLNLVPSGTVDVVDRLALTTGAPEPSPRRGRCRPPGCSRADTARRIPAALRPMSFRRARGRSR